MKITHFSAENDEENDYFMKYKIKVKQSLYRPRVVQRVLGS